MTKMTILPLTLSRAAGQPFAAWSPLAGGMPDWAALENALQNAAAKVQQALDAALQTLPQSPLRTQVYNARRDFFQRKKMPAQSTLQAWENQADLAQVLDNLHVLKIAQAQISRAERDFEQSLRANYRALQDIARDQTLCRALLFATHDLLQRLPAFAEKPIEAFDKKDRQTALSLSQYLARATFKTSPLSRFTTVQIHPLPLSPPAESPGEWGATKAICTPNVALLPALYDVLLREPAFFRALHLRLNPCVTAANWAGTEHATWLYFDGEREAFQRLDPDPVADFLVEKMLENRSAMRFADLLSALENEVEAEPKSLQSLVFQLVDIGLLEWPLPERGLSPGWCGSLYHFLGYLPSAPVLTDAAYLLQWLRTAARTLPFQPLEAAQATQREAVAQARAFFERHGGAMPPIAAEQVFFEDVAQIRLRNCPLARSKALRSNWPSAGARVQPPRSHLSARGFLHAQKKICPKGKPLIFWRLAKFFLKNQTPRYRNFSSKKSPRAEKSARCCKFFGKTASPRPR
jgi:hypothetical protein